MGVEFRMHGRRVHGLSAVNGPLAESAAGKSDRRVVRRPGERHGTARHIAANTLYGWLTAIA